MTDYLLLKKKKNKYSVKTPFKKKFIKKIAILTKNT